MGLNFEHFSQRAAVQRLFHKPGPVAGLACPSAGQSPARLEPTTAPGAQDRPWVPLASAAPDPGRQVIEQSEVSDVSLCKAIVAEGMNAELHPDGLLRVTATGGTRVLLTLSERLSLIHFSVYFSKPAGLDRDHLERFVAHVNDEIVLLRAAFDKDGDLMFDTYQSFRGGLLPSQIVHTIRLMELLALDTLRKLRATSADPR